MSENAKTEAGFYLEIEPLHIERLDDDQALRRQLDSLWADEMKVVPTPRRSDYQPVSKLPVVKAVKARSYTDFVRNVRLWTLERLDDGRTQIQEMVSPPGENYFVPSETSAEAFEIGISTESIFDRLVEIIRMPQQEDD